MTDRPTAHSFDLATGEYLDSFPAHMSPLEEGVPLVGSTETLDPPPDAPEGYRARWTGDAWELVEDHRGKTVYEAATGAATSIENLGPLPIDVTEAEPPSAFHFWQNGAWVEDAEAAARAAIPQIVSMRQARQALLAAGLLDHAETAVQAAGQAAIIDWEYATEVRRQSPLIAALAPGLGLSEADVDALFVTAAGIE